MPITINGSTGITFPDGTTQSDGLTVPVPVADGGTGLTSPGTAGNVLTSNGSGWVSSSPPPSNALVTPFNLASGTSAVLGRALLVDTNGQVGQYPAINTVGSFFANSSVDYYDSVSTDGSTAVSASTVTLNNTTYTVGFRGIAVNQTGTPTTGGNTVNLSATASGGSYGYGARLFIFPVSGTTFIAFVGRGSGNGSSEWFTLRAVVLTVDASTGTISAGSENTIINNIAGSPGERTDYLVMNILRASSTVYIIQADWAGGLASRDATASVSGTSISSAVSGGNSANNRAIVSNGNQTDNGISGALLTTNNLVVAFSGASRWLGQYTPGSGVLTSTDSGTQVISDGNSGGAQIKWYVQSPSRVMAFYYTNASTQVVRCYSVNQTTGALTLLGSLVLDSNNAYSSVLADFKSSTEMAFVYVYLGTSYFRAAQLNSDGTFIGASNPTDATTTGLYLRYNAGNFFANFASLAGPDPANRRCTVNAFSNRVLEFVGYPTTSTSSSPVNVTIGGVASGFTGLTPATDYFLSTAYDGTITTSNASGISVGTAISTTQMKV